MTITTYLMFFLGEKHTHHVHAHMHVCYHICQVNPLPSGRYGLRGVTLDNLFHVTGPDHHDYPEYPDHHDYTEYPDYHDYPELS